MRYTKIVLAIAIVFCSASRSQELEAPDESFKMKQALEIVRDFSNEICGSVPMEGSSEKTVLSGKAKADLNNLLKKVLDLGVDGAAKYQKGEYKGVLQADLAKLLSESKDCKLQIWNDLKTKLLLYPTTENKKIETAVNKKSITIDSRGIISYFEVVKYNVEDNKDYLTVKILIRSKSDFQGWIYSYVYDEDGVQICLPSQLEVLHDIPCTPTHGHVITFESKIAWASYPYRWAKNELQRGYINIPKDASNMRLFVP
jgi:hypothetical protein